MTLKVELEEPEPLEEVNELLAALSLESLFWRSRWLFSEEEVEEYAYLLLVLDATVADAPTLAEEDLKICSPIRLTSSFAWATVLLLLVVAAFVSTS